MRAMCGVELMDRKEAMDLIPVFCLNEIIDLLAMASSVRWYGHVLKREDGQVLKMALEFEVEGGKGGRKGYVS